MPPHGYLRLPHFFNFADVGYLGDAEFLGKLRPDLRRIAVDRLPAAYDEIKRRGVVDGARKDV